VSERRDSEPGRELYIAVGLVACAVLILEISLTRVLSVLLRFHFVFLVISSALCGLGVGGMLGLSSVRRLRERAGDRRILAMLALGAGLAVPLCLAALFRTPLSQRVFEPLTVPAVAIVPFLFCGAFLSYAFDRAVAGAGRLYFADLLGAATGALAVVLLLNALGGINAALAASVLFAAAAALVAGRGRRVLAWASGVVCLLSLGLVAANRSETILGLSTVRFDPQSEAAATSVKPLFSPAELGDRSIGSRIVATDWNAFARTDVVSNEGDPTLYVYTDGDVPTNMLRYDGTSQSVADVTSHTGFAGLVAGPRNTVLFIGPGGGLDVHLGIQAGAGEMIGVELNPSIPRLMYRFREHNGSVYATEGLRLYVDEGRSFIRRSPDTYDVIYAALTKTATTATSGLALVESHVFTVEGFKDYLTRLKPGGRLVAVLDQEVIARRALVTAIQALTELGESTEDAAHHCVLCAEPRALKTLAVLDEIAQEHGLPRHDFATGGRPLATDPSLWWADPYSHMLIVFKEPLDRAAAARAESILRRPWLNREPYREIAYTRDPFLSAAVPVLRQAIGKPLTKDEEERIGTARTEELAGLEVLFMPFLSERYEGLNIIASEGSIDEYVSTRERQNLAPVTDDRPFFLDIVKGANPVLTRLLVVPLVAVACGLLLYGLSVLRGWRRGAAMAREHAVSFAYFAVLGVGFMLIEVPLTQKLVLYLSYPSLTLSVVIFGLLVGGGLGSLWSQRRDTDRLAGAVTAAACLVALLGVGHAYVVPGLLHLTLGAPVFWRSAVALAVVVPLGLALGVPFPSGLRLSSRVLPGLTPRLWATNGILSTAGTVVAMVGGREVGFTQTLMFGCVCYLLVVLLVPSVGVASTKAPTAGNKRPDDLPAGDSSGPSES